jgi:hypothetical protein
LRVDRKRTQAEQEITALCSQKPSQKDVVAQAVVNTAIQHHAAKVPQLESKSTSLLQTAVMFERFATWLNGCKNRFVVGGVSFIDGALTSLIAVYLLAKTEPTKLFELFKSVDEIAGPLVK